jgi:mannobiose 2-epimerase
MAKQFLYIILLLSTLSACKQVKDSGAFLGIPIQEIISERDALLHLWYPKTIDSTRGGYLTNFDHDWQKSEDQEKMLVTQGRGLWTTSRAALVYPDEPMFKEAAEHGFRYLVDSMWDYESNGFFQFDKGSDSNPIDYKMTYGNAFALYALAEYADINPSREVMDWMKRSFQWMEESAHDPEKGGYFNLILVNPPENPDESYLEQVARLGWGGTDLKDQNSSIHIMEALTNVYRVWPDPVVRERLEEMLWLVRDVMTDPEGYLHLYFTSDWDIISFQDSSRAVIEANLNFDHRSFGHDIETAYLLIEASEVLYGDVDDSTLVVAKKLVDHTIEHGFADNFYGIFDRGYKFTPDGPVEIMRRATSWWAQAEAWHALALIYQFYPEEVYKDAFNGMWDYINTEVIDPEYGGWYGYGLNEVPRAKEGRKAHAWKGAYHNARALVQVVDMANGIKD